MIAERLMVGSEFGLFSSRLDGLRMVDGGRADSISGGSLEPDFCMSDLSSTLWRGPAFRLGAWSSLSVLEEFKGKSCDSWVEFLNSPTLNPSSTSLGREANTGDPKGRYCANLGHVEDDESNLIYMRARYYAPASGRFLSEDPDQDGLNWYVYCKNDPFLLDPSGDLTLIDFLSSSADEVAAEAANFQQSIAALGFAVADIMEALNNWAEQFSDALGDDFELVFGRQKQNRLWITGIDYRTGYQIAIDFNQGIVKAYGDSGQGDSLPPGVPHHLPLSGLLSPKE